MKILGLLILCVVAGSAGTFIRQRNGVRQQQQQAIASVINAAQKFKTQTRMLKNRRFVELHPNQVGFSRTEYVAGLETLSTGRCPERFRMAWLNYIQTLKRQSVPFSGLGALGEYGVSVVRPSAEGTKDALARLDRVNAPEAEMRVERVALEYGVQIMPITATRTAQP